MTRQSPSARAAAATNAHLSQFGDDDLAYHESGHAVVHHLNGGTVRRLSIGRADDPQRGCQLAPRPATDASADPQAALAASIAVLVGGEVAATLHGTPHHLVTAGGRVDHEAALRAAASAGIGVDEARVMIDAAWSREHERLVEPSAWGLVERLAQALLRDKVLDAPQIADLLAQ